MARKIFFITLIGIIGSVLFFGFKEAAKTPTTYAQARSLDGEIDQALLGSTVQIEMAREATRETTTVVKTSEGIGTLVNVNGQKVIVTHNHWSQLQDGTRPDWVRFYDAQGKRLLKIEGADFLANILYRDGGTLVMSAPDELVNQLQPATAVSESREVLQGEIVYVIHHQPGFERKLQLLVARVTAVNGAGQQTLLALQSVNGETIEPGDSGGGIWFEGQLVGNMWMAVRQEWYYSNTPEEKQVTFTDRSHAAGLTTDLLDLLGQSLKNLEEMPAIPESLVME